MKPLIIQVRVNEGQMRDANPHVPYSPEEIAEQTLECWRAGASVVHYHARDPKSGAVSSDPNLYAEVVRLVKKAECNIITFPTLGAFMLPTVDERLAHIMQMAKDPGTKPDAIPADMLTTNVDIYDPERKQFRGSSDVIYLNTTKMLQELCEKTDAVGVKAVPMMWNIAGVRLTRTFIEMGLVTQPLMCEFTVFGDGFEQFGHPATVEGLQALINFMPKDADWNWMVSVIGANPFPIHAYSIANEGHVAIGLGDHAYPELGFPTNAQLVSRIVGLANTFGRKVATSTEARQMMGLEV